MRKALSVIAIALGITALTAGAAFASCAGHTTQSVSNDSGSQSAQTPVQPKPEKSGS